MRYWSFLLSRKSRENDKFWLSLSLSREKLEVRENLLRKSKMRSFSYNPNCQFWASFYALAKIAIQNAVRDFYTKILHFASSLG